jgi:hypothetical protein
MADCYYHGYSGGPGDCGICERERERGQEEGSSGEIYDGSITAHDWQNGRYGRMADPDPSPPRRVPR